MTRSDGDYGAAVRLLRGAFLLDHSVSVSELGSIFERVGDAPLQQLKRNVARAYGVAWSFPAACGTSALNVLATLAVAPLGSTVIVNRDCHVSMQAAMVHGGLRPVYYLPSFDEEFGLPLGASAQSVEAALARHPEAACVVQTYPNYYGVAGECAAIVDAAHRSAVPVVVDAAHGAPMHFCTGLPAAAEDLGADIVLQSTHKTMGALSQGSIALFRTEDYVERFYDLARHLGFISTSFSYPTLSSIELAIARHEVDGEASWQQAIVEADRFRTRVARTRGVRPFDADGAARAGLCDLDRTRVTLDVSGTGLTGYEFARLLAGEQVYPELATPRHVLLLFTPGTRREDTNYLAAAVERAAEHGSGRGAAPVWRPPPPLPSAGLTPREAYFATRRSVDVADAVGELSGETIAPYPPGTAVVVAGEVLDGETIEYLQAVRREGGTLYGASDPEFRRVTIVAR